MSYPQRVKIVEVSVRDGLQNEKQIITTDTKLALINDLRASGVQHIEVTGFVSAKWVPQLADSSELCALLEKDEAVTYSALTPNVHGFEKAMAAGIKQVAIFTAVSESFNQKNINCSIDESFVRFEPLMLLARKQGIKVRGYVSCVLGCPYEGEIAVDKVVEVAKKLIDIGCFEVSLGDTIGVGTAKQAQEMFTACARVIDSKQLAIHFHDTKGQALANILACLEVGAEVIDASVAGLGGCPYAVGATGNVSTENVVYMLDGMGIETGINLGKLIKAGNNISHALGKKSNSQVANSCSS